MKAIKNGRLIVPDSRGEFRAEDNRVIIFGETIDSIVTERDFAAMEPSDFDEVIDAGGRYVSPGFVNLHVHGCVGADTMDCDTASLHKMAVFQASTGVTAFLPTTMTYDMPRIYRALDAVREAGEYTDGAHIIGAHMEGPFISEQYKGAQASCNIQKAAYSLLEGYEKVVRLITVAPEEIPEGSDFLLSCRRAGIGVSIGHSAASYECAIRSIKEGGIGHITHLFNAMTGFHHRNPGIVGAALDTDVFCEIIADNIHCAPCSQRIVHKIKTTSEVVLITDSMRACGLGNGESELGGQKVFVSGSRATLADGTIAGSVLTMDRAINNYSVNVGIPVWKAVECATITPARAIGMDKEIGSLTVGKAADIVLFDEQVNIAMTFWHGKQVFLK
ncbi:MAG: N-acetylglucosamine-6-phosphate deacetylase [Anaerovibrio sp.]|uniref:N-acetylglucosamine-6-phosphate deacetylase n=1 Tax=Anaerovibrio sp. TaxID=1872532 RepID=UPI0025F398EB|nr:N-acetylglucosamine-6-phosphate deacetylase [Anaerovibrio sp.]MCR5176547.1 N-acetylglucosamine-6-phosphate deacetylase [Anaerovibrio sp.]